MPQVSRRRTKPGRRCLSKRRPTLGTCSHAVAVAVAAELDRPITVFGMIRSARERHERVRRVELTRRLRALEPSASSLAAGTRADHGPEGR